MKNKFLNIFIFIFLVFSLVGCAGEMGPQGPQGEQGSVGLQGEKGEDGTSILTGDGAPLAIIGKNGDSYIDLLTWDFYVKNEMTWILKGNIKGESSEEPPSDIIGKIETEDFTYYPINEKECAVGIGYNNTHDHITIPSTYKQYKVTKIASSHNGFADSFDVKKIVIPSSVKVIESGAFKGCQALTNIEIPNSVIEVGSYAFYGCESLTTIKFPTSVKNIGYGALKGCVSIESLTVPKAEKVQFAHSLFDTKELLSDNECAPELKEVIITGGNSLGAASFSGFTSLNRIELADSISSIEYLAFYNCSNLKEINLPHNTETIGYLSFFGCEKLQNLVFPEKLKSIEGYAFVGCESLVIDHMPSSIISINDSAFYGCKSISTKKYGNSWYLGNNENPYVVLTAVEDAAIETYKVNAQTKVIYDNAFASSSNLKYIDIPDEIESVSSTAFSKCSELKYNEYENVKYLGNESNPYLVLIAPKESDITVCNVNERTKIIANNAFDGCELLENIDLSNVKRISCHAFDGCKSLGNILIPKSVVSIEENAFRQCGVDEITFENDIILERIGVGAFDLSKNLKYIVIPKGVKRISYSAFSVFDVIYCEDVDTNDWSDGWNSYGTAEIPVYWAGEWEYDDDGNPVPLI